MKRISPHLSVFWPIKLVILLTVISNNISAQDTSVSPTPTPTPTPSVQVKIPDTNLNLPEDTPVIAPNFEAPMRPLPSAERIGVDIVNQLPLTLEQAIEMALQNNNNIETSKIDVQIAEFNVMSARGVYDPQIVSENYYERATTPTASTIGGATNGSVTQSRFVNSTGLSGLSPFFGGSYSASFDASRLTTSNSNAQLNPQFPTSLVLSYTQPLFRGRRFDLARRNIEIANKNLSLSDAQFRQNAIQIISQVEQAYWDLVFNLRNLQVQVDAVKQARLQLESNQRMVAKGVIAPIDVVAATAQITAFEQNVYIAQEDVTRAENTLKTLVLPNRNAAEWSRPITPVSPINLEPPRPDLNAAIQDALANRPEISQLQTSAEINEIDRLYYRDQTKPQIDLVGTYTSAGLAGTPTRTNVVPNLSGGFFNSLGNLITQDYPTFRIGVQISIPWGNRVAKANLGRNLAEGNRIKTQLQQTEQTIQAEVRNALQALRSAEARLASAVASRQAAEQLYESEQRQFRGGVTTLYLVLQRQTELIAARGRELQAQTALNKAISEFQRATGTTLLVNNVTVSSGITIRLSPNLRPRVLSDKTNSFIGK